MAEEFGLIRPETYWGFLGAVMQGIRIRILEQGIPRWLEFDLEG